jgi:hypothetical protein
MLSQSDVEDAGEWILGAIGGEFTDEPTYGQIGVDFVLSIIPGVDQVADARDLVAHIYRLGFRGEHKSVMRWIGLAFTLIGLVPEVGSVIKSASKGAMRFIGRNIDTGLKLARKLIDKLGGGALLRKIISHWDDLARMGSAIWHKVLAGGGKLVDAIVTHLKKVFNFPSVVWDKSVRALNSRLEQLSQRSAQALPDAFKRAKERVQTLIDDLGERLGPQTATAGGPQISRISGSAENLTRADPMAMSSLGGGKHDPPFGGWSGPHSTGEAIDELEETVTRGSRSIDPGEADYLEVVKNIPVKRGGDTKAAQRGTKEHSRMKSELRPFEGELLDNGWIVKKVERTVGGRKRVDQLWIHQDKKTIAVTDFFTGKVEPPSHFKKGMNYQMEKEVQEWIKKGYKYEYHPVLNPPGKR